MTYVSQNDTSIEEISNEMKSKIDKMSNDDIGTLLYSYINNDNTKDFKIVINYCNKQSNNIDSKIDLNYIINKKYRVVGWPLIIKAAHKSNKELVELLIKLGVCLYLYVYNYICLL